MTHQSDRSRRIDTILLAAVLVVGLAFGVFVYLQDAEAKRRGDYFGCWTDACRSASAASAAERMSGSEEEQLPDRL